MLQVDAEGAAIINYYGEIAGPSGRSLASGDFSLNLD